MNGSRQEYGRPVDAGKASAGPAIESAPPPPRLLDQVRERIRTRHYSLRTEKAYVDWIKRFILHHGKRHPRDMGGVEVEAFLSSLAVERHVAASTQNQALAALLFLYREVLGLASFHGSRTSSVRRSRSACLRC